jgi:hypothetical protein
MHSQKFTEEPGQTLFAFPISGAIADWSTARVACTESGPGRYIVTVDESVDLEWLVFIGSAVPTSFDQAILAIEIPPAISTSIQVIPAIARTPEDECTHVSHIELFLNVSKSVTHGIYATDGVTPVDLSDMDLVICLAKNHGATIAEVEPLLVSVNTIQWLAPEIVTQREELYSWSLRDRSDGDAVIALGDLNVRYAARPMTA